MRTIRYNPFAAFFREFELGLVSGPELQDKAASLRHRVFSEEHGYEPITDCRRERDVYDRNSLHCLIYHRRTGMPASCIRLILAAKHSRMAIEDLCIDRVHLRYRERIAERRSAVCEVSRFAVDPAFRKATGPGDADCLESSGHEFTEQEQRVFPLLSTVALLSSHVMADLSGRQSMFCLMEPKTPRLIRRACGIRFEQAGEGVEHRGLRVPFHLPTQGALSQLKPAMQPLYQTIRSKISQDMDADIDISAGPAINTAKGLGFLPGFASNVGFGPSAALS